MNAHEQLLTVVHQQIESAELLLAILQEEKQALTGTDSNVLSGVTTRKHAQLERVEQLEGQRQKTCNALGMNAAGSAMTQLAAREPQLARAWQTLAGIVLQCRSANETNGIITRTRQRQVGQLMGLLRGGDGRESTYSAAGTTAVNSNSRALARA
jgi:flagella synthesis protein FlgN